MNYQIDGCVYIANTIFDDNTPSLLKLLSSLIEQGLYDKILSEKCVIASLAEGGC